MENFLSLVAGSEINDSTFSHFCEVSKGQNFENNKTHCLIRIYFRVPIWGKSSDLQGCHTVAKRRAHTASILTSPFWEKEGTKTDDLKIQMQPTSGVVRDESVTERRLRKRKRSKDFPFRPIPGPPGRPDYRRLDLGRA